MWKLLGPFFGPLGMGGGGKEHYDDDFVDRLNHSYSMIVFLVCAILVSTKAYVGEPIHCWVPGHFTKNYEEFTNKMCWVSNTYRLPYDKPIPGETPTDMITYYQWVHFFLLCQAILFYLPCLVWRGLSEKSGIDLSNLMEASKTMSDPDSRDKTLRYMVRQMDRYLGHYNYLYKTRCFSNFEKIFKRTCCGKRYGNYMTMVFIVTKVLYLANALAQLFILDLFLSADFHMYGVQVIRAMVYKTEWPSAAIFPRTTMCDFEVRAMGNVHRHTVQCVLAINFFNEKIFIFIWFWLVFVCLVTFLNLLLWLARVIFRTDQIRYVRHYLRSIDKIKPSKPEDKRYSRKFALDYLRPDGILVLRLMKINVNGLAVAEFVGVLWDNFRSNPRIGDKEYDTRRDSEGDIADV